MNAHGTIDGIMSDAAPASEQHMQSILAVASSAYPYWLQQQNLANLIPSNLLMAQQSAAGSPGAGDAWSSSAGAGFGGAGAAVGLGGTTAPQMMSDVLSTFSMGSLGGLANPFGGFAASAQPQFDLKGVVEQMISQNMINQAAANTAQQVRAMIHLEPIPSNARVNSSPNQLQILCEAAASGPPAPKPASPAVSAGQRETTAYTEAYLKAFQSATAVSNGVSTILMALILCVQCAILSNCPSLAELQMHWPITMHLVWLGMPLAYKMCYVDHIL
jgi:hypothetical protein